MNLRTLAGRDLERILGDEKAGFGWPIVLTGPSGFSAPLVGFSTDISAVVDPETGQVVSARTASVALPTSTIRALFNDRLPQGVTDTDRRPWVVEFADIGGESHTFKVVRSDPDRVLGMVVCTLELYRRVY